MGPRTQRRSTGSRLTQRTSAGDTRLFLTRSARAQRRTQRLPRRGCASAQASTRSSAPCVHVLIEMTFGILHAKWRILCAPLDYPADVCADTLLCCALLHNFCIDHDVAFEFRQVTHKRDRVWGSSRGYLAVESVQGGATVCSQVLLSSDNAAGLSRAPADASRAGARRSELVSELARQYFYKRKRMMAVEGMLETKRRCTRGFP